MHINVIDNLSGKQYIKCKNKYATNILKSNINSQNYYPTFKADLQCESRVFRNVADDFHPDVITGIAKDVKDGIFFSQLSVIKNFIKSYLERHPYDNGKIFNKIIGNGPETLLMQLLTANPKYQAEDIEFDNTFREIIDILKPLKGIDYEQIDSEGNSFINNALKYSNGKYFLLLMEDMPFIQCLDKETFRQYNFKLSEIKIMRDVHTTDFNKKSSNSAFVQHTDTSKRLSTEWLDLLSKQKKGGKFYKCLPINPDDYNDLPSEQFETIPYIIESTNYRFTKKSNKTLSKLYNNQEALKDWFHFLNRRAIITDIKPQSKPKLNPTDYSNKSKSEPISYAYYSMFPERYADLPSEPLAMIPHIINMAEDLTTNSQKTLSYLCNDRHALDIWMHLITEEDFVLTCFTSPCFFPENYKKLSTAKLAIVPYIKEAVEKCPMADEIEKLTDEQVTKIDYIGRSLEHYSGKDARHRLNLNLLKLLCTFNEKQLQESIELLKSKDIITDEMLENCNCDTFEALMVYLNSCKVKTNKL